MRLYVHHPNSDTSRPERKTPHFDYTIVYAVFCFVLFFLIRLQKKILSVFVYLGDDRGGKSMFIHNNNNKKKRAFKTCRVCSAAPPPASRASMLTQNANERTNKHTRPPRLLFDASSRRDLGRLLVNMCKTSLLVSNVANFSFRLKLMMLP